MQIPESLSLSNHLGKSKSELDSINQKLNYWHEAHSQPDTLMFYTIGRSLMDPKFLVIKFDGNAKAADFWVESN